MIELMLVSVLALVALSPAAAPPLRAAPACPIDDPALDAQLAAAGKDVPKLLELAATFSAAGQDDAARKAFTAVLEVDAANEVAHKGLRHQFYDGKWFTSFAELSKYKREETAAMKAKGLAKYKDAWVPEADLPFLKLGWSKDASGAWVNPVEAARAAKVAELEAAGWIFRADDNSWVAPEDKDKLQALLWKCGDEWLEMKVADAYHAEMGKWWELVGEHFTVWTTCDWEGGNWARWYADKTWPDLVRIFGVEPAGRPHFIVLNGIEQYNTASGGNPPLIPESEGSSSVYGAYFADSFLDTSVRPPQYLGAGVSFWARNDKNLSAWGPYWLRWAAAQSFVEAIDPSWGAVADVVSGGQADGAAALRAFWTEKKVPRWLRYGAASYADRYLKNPQAVEGSDPWDLRAYAFGELKKGGGLRKLDDVFAFNVDLQKLEDTAQLYHEAGLLVSFLLDGAPEDKDLAAKHAAFKQSLREGSKADVSAAVQALQQALAANEPQIRAFAGL